MLRRSHRWGRARRHDGEAAPADPPVYRARVVLVLLVSRRPPQPGTMRTGALSGAAAAAGGGGRRRAAAGGGGRGGAEGARWLRNGAPLGVCLNGDWRYRYPLYFSLTVDQFSRRILQPASDQILGQPEPRMNPDLKNPNEAASALVRRASLPILRSKNLRVHCRSRG
jgi:hypothetical protein